MREILFRGKGIDGKWFYGNYLSLLSESCNYIGMVGGGIKCVIPETVGQFTGLTDKNGVKIFEGDVVRECYKNCDIEEFRYNIGKVFYCEKAARFLLTSRRFPDCYADMSIYREYEVIGNIHDNPELLKEEENV